MNGSDKNDFIDGRKTETGVGLGSFVLRVAVKTLLVLLVIFALAATLVGCLFPKTYMNMYRSLGLYGKATVYAAAAAERARGTHGVGCDGSCEYSALLTDGVGLASIVCDTQPDATHVRRLCDFAGDYLRLECHEKHSAKIDAMYLKEYGARGLASLSVLYGYDDYVWGEYIGAMSKSDYDQATELIDVALAAEVSTSDAQTLNMLTAYIDYDPLWNLPPGTDTTAVVKKQCPHFYSAANYGRLLNIYSGYSDLATSLPAETTAQTALKANLLYRLWSLADNMDRLEANYDMFTSYAAPGDEDYELALLVRQDLFGTQETARVKALYTAVASGKDAA